MVNLSGLHSGISTGACRPQIGACKGACYCREGALKFLPGRCRAGSDESCLSLPCLRRLLLMCRRRCHPVHLLLLLSGNSTGSGMLPTDGAVFGSPSLGLKGPYPLPRGGFH